MTIYDPERLDEELAWSEKLEAVEYELKSVPQEERDSGWHEHWKTHEQIMQLNDKAMSDAVFGPTGVNPDQAEVDAGFGCNGE